MAETGGGSAALPPPERTVPPMITLPPRSSFDTFLTDHSPGPMTIVSNFFSDQYPEADLRSFSQLLAGALASPAAQNPPAPVFNHDSFSNCEEGSGGYKQNRPMDLVITQSPSGLSPFGFFSPLQSPLVSHQQALAHVTAQAVLSQSLINCIQPENRPYLLAASEEESQTAQTSDPEGSQIESLDNVSVSQFGNSKPQPVVPVTKPASDGYNWRKYGQKQVMASKRPRCYYRCTQSNCSVTKKIGHFLDGNISEIIYKGQHNHEPPQLHKRAQQGATMNKLRSFLEEPVNDHEQVNHLMANEDAGDEPNPKRRKTEVGSVELTCSSRGMATEPKIVVQTRSEVDILDDGFKWRKYGQKVVKGNTYARGYYKCTYAGCKVRKHVERASSDPKSVVTTYDGKHKHDVPVVAKPSSHNLTNFVTERPNLLQLKEEQIGT